MEKPFKDRFWVRDSFVREYAKHLSVYGQMTYITLCCFANKEGITFVGCRKIAELLNINKDTANKSINILEASHLIRRLDKNKGKPSHIKILSVPTQSTLPSPSFGHKEYNKELIKERNKTTNKYNGRKKAKEGFSNYFKKQGKSPNINF